MAKRSKKLPISDFDPKTLPDDQGVLAPGPGRESFKIASYWKQQIDAVDQAQSKWIKRGNTVVKRFRDERSRVEEDGRRMAILWAYVKILKPALYGKCPIPNIDRKFMDKDPIARLSAQILERSTRSEVKANGFHDAVNMAVLDYLLPGRGQVWVRYEPEIGEGVSLFSGNAGGTNDALNEAKNLDPEEAADDETPGEEQLESSGNQLLTEKIPVDYIDWKDYYQFPAKARTEREIQAKGKKCYISKEEAVERFGKEIAKNMKPDTTPMGTSTERQAYSDTSIFQDINERNIVVYEIWNKSDKRVYWVSPGYDFLCDVLDDPLELMDFFPCPKPITATITNDSLMPVPDYMEWQDQAIQIDELTYRIAMLTKACKVAGAYDANASALKRILNESVENELIPVDSWAVFADKGGVKGAMSFLPLEEIQSCISTLQEVRQQAKQDLDEITGVNDVLRGTTDSRETLGGIRLKNNNTGTRLSDRQDEIARFARDTIAIIAEIGAKHFDENTLVDSSGIMFEEELQPETVLAEWEAANMPTGGASPMPIGAPKQGGQQLQLPAPAGGQGMLPQGSPGGGNVVPFPGAPQQSQLQPGQMGGMAPQMPTPLIPQPDPQHLIALKIIKAIELLRKDVTRWYRIEIETDSTIYGDKSQEKQDATEFITAFTSLFQAAETLTASLPEAIPLFGRFMEWGMRKFRVGRDLESSVADFVSKMDKKAKMLIANPPPDPEQQKVQAEIQQMQMEGNMQAQNDQRDAEKQRLEDERSARLQEADDTRKFMMERAEQEHKQRMMDMEMQRAQAEHSLEMERMHLEGRLAREAHESKLRELKAQEEMAIKKAKLQAEAAARKPKQKKAG